MYYDTQIEIYAIHRSDSIIEPLVTEIRQTLHHQSLAPQQLVLSFVLLEQCSYHVQLVQLMR